MLQRCLNDAIMFLVQKGARLRGMVPHTHRSFDSAYGCADLSHKHDVCHLKKTCTPKGEESDYILILNYAVGLDVARVGPI